MEIVNVDFNNADELGRVRLNTAGALQSIQLGKIELIEGMEVNLNDEDGLSNTGIIKFSKNENIWVAEIDWDKFTHY